MADFFDGEDDFSERGKLLGDLPVRVVAVAEHDISEHLSNMVGRTPVGSAPLDARDEKDRRRSDKPKRGNITDCQ